MSEFTDNMSTSNLVIALQKLAKNGSYRAALLTAERSGTLGERPMRVRDEVPMSTPCGPSRSSGAISRRK